MYVVHSTVSASTSDFVGWLVGKGKTAEARKVLVYKYGGVEGYDIDGELVSSYLMLHKT